MPCVTRLNQMSPASAHSSSLQQITAQEVVREAVWEASLAFLKNMLFADCQRAKGEKLEEKPGTSPKKH